MNPSTLAQTFEKIAVGEPAEHALSEFLGTFFLAPTAGKRLATLADPPAPTGKPHLDALAGAIAEYLAKQYRLPHVPDWASEPHRYLDSPWHVLLINSEDKPLPQLSDAGFREYLTFASPAEFRSRNIFTEERPLRPGRSGQAQ
jgi:hypothetical protein